MFWGDCMGNPTYDRQYFEGFVRELNALMKKWGVSFCREGGRLDTPYEIIPDAIVDHDGVAEVRMNFDGTYRVEGWVRL